MAMRPSNSLADRCRKIFQVFVGKPKVSFQLLNGIACWNTLLCREVVNIDAPIKTSHFNEDVPERTKYNSSEKQPARLMR